MAYDVNSIRMGAARLFIGGQELGFSDQGVSIEIRTTTKRVEIDHFTSVETRNIITRRDVVVKFNLVETTLANLFLICGNGTQSGLNSSNGATINAAFGYDLAKSNTPFWLHPMDRLDGDRSEDIILPNAVWDGNITFAYKKDTVRVFTVEIIGHPDANGGMLSFGNGYSLPNSIASNTGNNTVFPVLSSNGQTGGTTGTGGTTTAPPPAPSNGQDGTTSGGNTSGSTTSGGTTGGTTGGGTTGGGTTTPPNNSVGSDEFIVLQ